MDFLTFANMYSKRDPAIANERVYILARNTPYDYSVLEIFLAFASATLAVSVTALLDYIDNDPVLLKEISLCCLDKKLWDAVKFIHFPTHTALPDKPV